LLVTLAVQPASAAPPSYGRYVHIVRWGQTLSGIAARYGTTVWAIMRANGLANPNRIYAGQRLVIPRATGHTYPHKGAGYVVRRGDTLSGIAYRFGVSVNSLIRANGLANPNRIYAGQRLVIPRGAAYHAPRYGAPGHAGPGHGRHYIVRRGDTLSGIAWRYGVSTWAIASANHLANPNVIYAGQRLYIP
jgi:putative chitinase